MMKISFQVYFPSSARFKHVPDLKISHGSQTRIKGMRVKIYVGVWFFLYIKKPNLLP